MANARLNIPLTEEFHEDSWVNYDAYEEITRNQFKFQRHVDIRTFTPDSNEKWTFSGGGTSAYLSEVAKYPGIEIKVAAENIEAASKTPEHTVNLAQLEPSDIVTFALPKFPLAHVSLAESYIDLTSDPEGDFTKAAVTKSVAFSSSLTPLVEGESQFSIHRSAFEEGEINLEKITGVRFRIKGTASTKVLILGLKLISAPGVNREANPGWKRSTVDFDNWNGRLRKPNPINGETSISPEFTQGILWRAAPLAGPNDPQPVDGEFGIVFNTGSQSATDKFILYLREESKIFQSQLDLISVTQAELDGNPQPDLGEKEFVPRYVGEMEGEDMEEIDSETMEELERKSVPNPVEESWIYFELTWGKGESGLVMANSTSAGYSFPGLEGATLHNNADYLMICTLEGPSARTRIFELNADLSVKQKPIFDTKIISDDNIFRRRKGRIGWSALLEDNDSFVRSIRPRGVSFAEYKSAPLISHTPVSGAQLFASFTGNTQLWDGGFNQYPKESKNSILLRDSSRALSKESFRIITKGVRGQGVETDPILFTDFNQMEIHFALWFSGPPREKEIIEHVHPPLFPGPEVFPGEKVFPSGGYTNYEEFVRDSIIAELISNTGSTFSLTMPELETNQWQHIVLRIPPSEILQTGPLSLRITQNTTLATNWWIDEVSIFERAIQWSARSVTDDPWMGNYAPWTDFDDIINDKKSGIVISPQGKELQLRAKALRQDAIIQKPELVPRYASLGRLVWPENALKVQGPTAKFKSTKTGSIFTFTDESTEGASAIGMREWSFGDGTRIAGNTQVIEHTYAEHGTYSVTETIMDGNGKTSSFEKEVEA